MINVLNFVLDSFLRLIQLFNNFTINGIPIFYILICTIISIIIIKMILGGN